MSGIIWKTVLHELTAIEAIDKDLHSPLQSIDKTGKTSRAACQTGQIMTQFSIATCYRIRIGLAIRNFITTTVIPETLISIKSIAMVLLGKERSPSENWAICFLVEG